MRKGTYLNVILTINAVLLTGLLWVQVVAGPVGGGQQAHAQSVSGTGIPNAADQRQRMIESLREIKTSVDGTRKLLESGRIKAEVVNIDQLKVDAPKE